MNLKKSSCWPTFSTLWPYYRPQQSWAKVMFLQASVILLTGRSVCLSACWDTHPLSRHPQSRQPPQQTPPTPMGADPPRADPPSRHPPGSRHPLPGADTPQSRHLPEQTASLGSRLQHTVNKKPLRILLECILVWTCIRHVSAWYSYYHTGAPPLMLAHAHQ